MTNTNTNTNTKTKTKTNASTNTSTSTSTWIRMDPTDSSRSTSTCNYFDSLGITYAHLGSLGVVRARYSSLTHILVLVSYTGPGEGCRAEMQMKIQHDMLECIPQDMGSAPTRTRRETISWLQWGCLKANSFLKP